MRFKHNRSHRYWRALHSQPYLQEVYKRRPLGGFRFTVSKTFPGDFVHAVTPRRRNVQRLGRDYRASAAGRASAKDYSCTPLNAIAQEETASPRRAFIRAHAPCRVGRTIEVASPAFQLPHSTCGGGADVRRSPRTGLCICIGNDMMPLTCVARSRQRTPGFLARSAAAREVSLWAMLRASPSPQACRADL